MAIQIKKAVRERVYLKVAVGGSTGSGKTWGSIGLAKGLAPTGKVLVIDSENRSASYYAGEADQPGAWDFDVVEIDAPFTTHKYLEALKAAVDNGYEAVVIDSLTHEWTASGGILDQKSQKDARGGNSFTNWNEMKQLHNKFVETLLQSKIHVICTLRSKMEYALEQDDKGKSSVRKIGLAPISSDGMEYEFGVFFDVDRNTHQAIATKDRTGLFEGRSVLLGSDIGKELLAWRDSGAELRPEPAKAAPAAAAAPRAAEVPQARPTQAAAPQTPTVTSTPAPEPPADWLDAMAELAAATLGMPEKTRAALVADFEAQGPVALPALRQEIANIRQVMEPSTPGGVFAAMPRPEGGAVSQEVTDFVNDLDPRLDQVNGGISGTQYEALGALIAAHGINRDALRAYMAKAGHLLPGANGPTLARMKAEEFVKLRDKLNNHQIAAKGETWAVRTVRIINNTPVTTYQPVPAAS